MKRKEIIFSIVGIVIISTMVLPSVTSTFDYQINQVEPLNETMDYTTHSTIELGEVWSLNQENSFGFSDLSIKKDVYVDWSTAGLMADPAQPAQASGYLQLLMANMFTNLPGQEFSHFRLSTYTIKVYDGPSTDDVLLFEQDREILENAGNWMENLNFPITIESKGQSIRNIAVECIAQTRIISNLLKTPFQGFHGIRSAVSNLHINFDSQLATLSPEPIEPAQHHATFNRSTVNLDLGTIKVVPSNRSGQAMISTNELVNNFAITLNRSEMPYTINVNVGYGTALNEMPVLNFLSRILGTKVEFVLVASSFADISTLNRTTSIFSDSDVITLTAETLNRTESFNRSFILDATPSELIFLVSGDVSYERITSWKLPIPDEELFDSQLIRIAIDYT